MLSYFLLPEPENPNLLILLERLGMASRPFCRSCAGNLEAAWWSRLDLEVVIWKSLRIELIANFAVASPAGLWFAARYRTAGETGRPIWPDTANFHQLTAFGCFRIVCFLLSLHENRRDAETHRSFVCLCLPVFRGQEGQAARRGMELLGTSPPWSGTTSWRSWRNCENDGQMWLKCDKCGFGDPDHPRGPSWSHDFIMRQGAKQPRGHVSGRGSTVFRGLPSLAVGLACSRGSDALTLCCCIWSWNIHFFGGGVWSEHLLQLQLFAYSVAKTVAWKMPSRGPWQALVVYLERWIACDSI